MQITAIEKAGGSRSGNRYTVFVDGEYWYILDLEIILKNSLKPGREIDGEELEEIRVQAERRTARERAYYLLEYREHSKKELYDKLLKSSRPEIAGEIVALMEEQGLLDDARCARNLARHYLEDKKWGRRRALLEMRRRGIEASLAEEALEDCEVDSRAHIRAIVERKYLSALSEGYKGRQRVIAGLARLGYEWDDIHAVLSEYREEET